MSFKTSRLQDTAALPFHLAGAGQCGGSQFPVQAIRRIGNEAASSSYRNRAIHGSCQHDELLETDRTLPSSCI